MRLQYLYRKQIETNYKALYPVNLILKDKIVKKIKFEKKGLKYSRTKIKKSLAFLIAIVKKPSPLEYIN